jgi:hypothetical protein
VPEDLADDAGLARLGLAPPPGLPPEVPLVALDSAGLPVTGVTMRPSTVTVRRVDTGELPVKTLRVTLNDPPATLQVTAVSVQPGTVRVVVRPLLFESLACLDTRAAYALQATAMPCTPIRPPNDRCDTALPASVGLNAFDCGDATSDPAWLASWCNEGAGLTFTNDVWLSFQAPSTGAYRFSTCGLSPFDVRMALYEGCGGQVLACSDDACPDGGAAMETGLMCGSITPTASPCTT